VLFARVKLRILESVFGFVYLDQIIFHLRSLFILRVIAYSQKNELEPAEFSGTIETDRQYLLHLQTYQSR
jgi:hypothetical protein